MIMNKLVVWLAVCLGGISSALYADTGKPVVWIYTDMSDKSIPGPNKEGTVNDPDDISAMAGYLLLADCFDTRGIVVASTHRKQHATSGNQAEWAQHYFGEAYAADVVNLRLCENPRPLSYSYFSFRFVAA